LADMGLRESRLFIAFEGDLNHAADSLPAGGIKNG